MRENLHSSNKRCTIVYKQKYNRKLNSAKVKQTATESYFRPDETNRDGVGVCLKEKTPTSTPD